MSAKLFVISGPSGAGKGTLVSNVLSRRGGIWLSISATTRAPRKGEVPNQSYYFLSDEEFQRLVNQDGFLEWAQVHDKCYGTLRSKVEEHLHQGTDVLLEIDPQGAFQVKANYPDAILIFIEPPSMEVLEDRLRNRGTETEEQIQLRLHNALLEMQQKKDYNIVLVNDDLEKATQELLNILETA